MTTNHMSIKSETITNEEWLEISHALEPHHVLFYHLWQMGRPVFDERIETAAVSFDKQGEFCLFLFNPKFWNSLSFDDKLWVICHEALHIILNHGLRTLNMKSNKKAVNAALDIVVNHLLWRGFGFERDKVSNWKSYCWIDTVFPHKNPLPPDDETFEYYYNLFDKTYGDGGVGDGTTEPQTVDDHSEFLENSDGEKFSKIIDQLNEALSEEEKESLKDVVEKHFEKSVDQKAESSEGCWTFVKKENVKKKNKWETVIKKWSKKHITDEFKDVEQWARRSRRLSMLSDELFLPSDMDVHELEFEERKINVWFFLDTSGSTIHLKDRFFNAAKSLPTERFDVRLFCFDTKVEETTLASAKIYGGGGTSFSILEKHIQNELKSGPGNKTLHDKTIVEKITEYPSAIFVITDGYGDQIKPEKPKNWYWFLTDNYKNCVPQDSNIFQLKDYE